MLGATNKEAQITPLALFLISLFSSIIIVGAVSLNETLSNQTDNLTELTMGIPANDSLIQITSENQSDNQTNEQTQEQQAASSENSELQNNSSSALDNLSLAAQTISASSAPTINITPYTINESGYYPNGTYVNNQSLPAIQPSPAQPIQYVLSPGSTQRLTRAASAIDVRLLGVNTQEGYAVISVGGQEVLIRPGTNYTINGVTFTTDSVRNKMFMGNPQPELQMSVVDS